MNLSKLRKFSSKSSLSVIAGVVLVFGLFGAVVVVQQQQEVRSRAAGTGNCATLNPSTDELVADDCTVNGGLNNAIRGNRNTIRGGLGGSPGDIWGNDNLVMGGMNGTITGNGNEICGGLGGSINGNNNIIHGGINGTDNGTGNIINSGGTCGIIRQPTTTPTSVPTQQPATCKDGIDNNQNELIDGGDPVCHTDGNQNNPNSYDPTRNEGPGTVTPTTVTLITPTVTPIACQVVSHESTNSIAQSGNFTSATLSHTVPNKSNTFLMVTVGYKGNLGKISSVKSGNTLFTSFGGGGRPSYSLYAFYIKSPTAGENSITVNWGEPVQGYVITASTYSGVDQTLPYPVDNSIPSDFRPPLTGTSFNPNLALETKSSNSLFGISVLYPNSNGKLIPKQGTTETVNRNDGATITGLSGYSSISTSGTYKIGWEHSASQNDFAFNAFELKSASCTPTPTSGQQTQIPTPIPPAGNTSIKLNLLLHGLGKGGDSANANSGGNPDPIHKQRSVTVEVHNNQNQLVVTKQGSVTFNSAGGNFIGTVDLGSTLTTGFYNVRVKTTQFLKTLVPGIQNLTAGITNQLPSTILVNGDIKEDNVLNILDYNILMGCYSDFEPAPSCTAANKLLSDLDDDGDVNQFDYNLFLREITNRTGQ